MGVPKLHGTSGWPSDVSPWSPRQCEEDSRGCWRCDRTACRTAVVHSHTSLPSALSWASARQKSRVNQSAEEGPSNASHRWLSTSDMQFSLTYSSMLLGGEINPQEAHPKQGSSTEASKWEPSPKSPQTRHCLRPRNLPEKGRQSMSPS